MLAKCAAWPPAAPSSTFNTSVREKPRHHMHWTPPWSRLAHQVSDVAAMPVILAVRVQHASQANSEGIVLAGYAENSQKHTLMEQRGQRDLARPNGVGGGQGGDVGGGGLPGAVAAAPGALRPVAEAVTVLALPVAQVQPHH